MTIQNQITSFGQGNIDALVKSGSVAVEGFKEISTAYANLLSQSTARTTAAVQTLLAVKTPTDLPNIVFGLTQSTIDQAIADGRKFQEVVTEVASNSVAPLTSLFDVATGAAKKATKAA